MTLREIIDAVDGRKPNAYTDEDKIDWINELEYDIQTNVYDRAEDFLFHESVAEEPMLGAEWGRLYRAYLEAKIAAENGEFSEYANLAEMYNEAAAEFQAWYARHHIDPEE